MAKEMTTEQVLDVLETRDFDRLIGTIESEVLDFKGAPYELESTKEKLELAKDISGLANAGGGIIVMGIETSVLEGRPHELAERIRSFGETLVEVKQYEDIIDKWVYPRLQAEVKWVPSAADDKKGVAYIRVAESQSERKPFLTLRVLEERDRILGNVVGFFQRKGDKVVHWSAEELHHAFKDGCRFDEHLSEISETLGKILSERRAPASPAIDEEAIERRITNAIEAVGLADSTSYVLVSYPQATVEITGVFESRTSDVVKLIDDPPEFRRAGFDIRTHEHSRIVNGEFRRSVLKPRKLLEVWRDGAVVFVADGDEGFLCWGDHAKTGFLRINTIALIESVCVFGMFVKELFQAVGVQDCGVQMALQIRNVPTDRKYGLSEAKPGSVDWRYNFDDDIAWASDRNLIVGKSWAWHNTTPEKGAYQLVSELYAKFGVEHEHIPFVKEHDGEKVIDIEQIKNMR